MGHTAFSARISVGAKCLLKADGSLSIAGGIVNTPARLRIQLPAALPARWQLAPVMAQGESGDCDKDAGGGCRPCDGSGAGGR